MLEHAFRRAQKLIAAERLVTVVSDRHLENVEVRRQLSRQPPGCVIAQPDNRETAPGFLLVTVAQLRSGNAPVGIGNGGACGSVETHYCWP